MNDKYSTEELQDLVADGIRYRFLRDTSTSTWKSFQEQWNMSAKECDNLIDRHMTEVKNEI